MRQLFMLPHFCKVVNVLFICNFNRQRSKTAEQIFNDLFSTKSAGLYNNAVTQEQLDWAEVIAVMNEEMQKELLSRFPSCKKRIVVLDIPSMPYMSPELIAVLKERVSFRL
ncbi:MAG: phosphotyrosine protein phosphatase [archaeon]